MVKELQGYDDKRYDLTNNERKEARRRFIFKSMFWFISIPLVVGLAFFICFFGLDKTKVVNNSMAPTLDKDDSIVVNKMAYMFFNPSRFDVIVIHDEEDEHSVYDVKRIYALPGETIQINNGDIIVNGEVIEDPVKVEPMELAGIASLPLTLGKDEYFVLADDRINSEDSRYANYGLVKERNILGKAWLRTNNFGFVNMFNKYN